jgi:predicted phosphodiesterase
MKTPVRILSDLHLGHRLTRVPDPSRLRPLLEGVGTVLFNGDSWQELGPPTARRTGGEALEQLQQLCQEMGCDSVFLPGNHDPGWPGPGWAELAGGRIIVSHGDALLPSGSPWKREILRHPDRVEAIRSRFPAADHDPLARHQLARAIADEMRTIEPPRGRGLLRRALDAATPPGRAWEMLKAWQAQAAAGAAFLERYFPQATFLILGHFHHAGCWTRNGKIIVNTGSFVSPGHAWCVDWTGSELRRSLIRESKAGCHPDAPFEIWRIAPPRPGS